MLSIVTSGLLVVAASGCRNGLQLRTCSEVKLSEPLQVALPDTIKPLQPFCLEKSNAGKCYVAILDVDGALLNRNDPDALAGENPVSVFREKLDIIRKNPNVIGVLLRINSPGGSVLATEIMHQDLQEFRHQSGIPVVACVMDVGAGGGYYLATAADSIICHRGSLVGGIGVVVNIVDKKEVMATMNVFDQSVQSGEHITMGSCLDQLPESVAGMFDEIAAGYHQSFKDLVCISRGQQLSSDEVLDGRIVTGEQAKMYGLVDAIGDMDMAFAQVAEMAGQPQAGLLIYRRPNDHAGSAYAQARQLRFGGQLIPFSIPGLDRQALPTFLYMWQPTPREGPLSAADQN